MKLLYSRGEYLIILMASKLWFRRVVFETFQFSLHLMLFHSLMIQIH